MKKILILLALLLSSTIIYAQMRFANTNTGYIGSSLPNVIVKANGDITYQPTTNMLIAAGWRLITSIESPAAGWEVDSYSISNSAQVGRCTLKILTQHNIQASIDSSFTNSSLWDANLVTNAQAFRRIVRNYLGEGAETNVNITDKAITTWAIKRTLTAGNVTDILLLGRAASDLKEVSGNTRSFPWHLIP